MGTDTRGRMPRNRLAGTQRRVLKSRPHKTCVETRKRTCARVDVAHVPTLHPEGREAGQHLQGPELAAPLPLTLPRTRLRDGARRGWGREVLCSTCHSSGHGGHSQGEGGAPTSRQPRAWAAPLCHEVLPGAAE